MVKSNNIYAPQNYVAAVTGKYYCFKHDMHPSEEIQYLLVMHAYELWDYPLTEIDHIVENNLNVVLVDCSHYEGDTFINEYRWFEVPEDFKDEEEDNEDYIPSSTNGDYSPSNPWDAPGMSISDFI